MSNPQSTHGNDIGAPDGSAQLTWSQAINVEVPRCPASKLCATDLRQNCYGCYPATTILTPSLPHRSSSNSISHRSNRNSSRKSIIVSAVVVIVRGGVIILVVLVVRVVVISVAVVLSTSTSTSSSSSSSKVAGQYGMTFGMYAINTFVLIYICQCALAIYFLFDRCSSINVC